MSTTCFRETKVKKSRKDHFCDGCATKIPKGSFYIQNAGLFEGDFYSGCICILCKAFLSAHSKIFDYEGWGQYTLPEYDQYKPFKQEYERIQELLHGE